MANVAAFTINGTASTNPVTGDPKYEATLAETLICTLEANPSSVISVTYSIVDAAIPASPVASKDAPAITWTSSSLSTVTPTDKNGSENIDVPASGIHSYLIRATASTLDGPIVFERLVIIRAASGVRKTVPAESTQGEARGWSDALNEMVDVVEANLAGQTAYKLPVVVATTANIALTAEQTIDGVLTASSRVLVKDQSVPAENGIYVSSSGAWTRATDFDLDAEVFGGVVVAVSEGPINAPDGASLFQLTTDDPITVGVTGLAFLRIVTAPGGSPDLATVLAIDAFTGGESILWTEGDNLIRLGTGTANWQMEFDQTAVAVGSALNLRSQNGGGASAGGALTGVAGVGGGTSGPGGALTLAAGQGGATAGDGGTFAGVGGASQGAGDGGEADLTGGAGGSTGGGGDAEATGGAGGSVSGAAGGVTLRGGTPVDGAGGPISITGTAGVGTSRAGGGVNITSGNSTNAVNGANVTVDTGTSGSGTSGFIQFSNGGASTCAIVSGVGTIPTSPGILFDAARTTIAISHGQTTGDLSTHLFAIQGKRSDDDAGGPIELRGGPSAAAGLGGPSSVIGGGASGTGTGGSANVLGGTPVDGIGGAANVTGAAGVGTSRLGGAVNITAGNSTNAINGADVNIDTGTSGSGTSGSTIFSNGGTTTLAVVSGVGTVPTSPGVLFDVALTTIAITHGQTTGDVSAHLFVIQGKRSDDNAGGPLALRGGVSGGTGKGGAATTIGGAAAGTGDGGDGTTGGGQATGAGGTGGIALLQGGSSDGATVGTNVGAVARVQSGTASNASVNNLAGDIEMFLGSNRAFSIQDDVPTNAEILLSPNTDFASATGFALEPPQPTDVNADGMDLRFQAGTGGATAPPFGGGFIDILGGAGGGGDPGGVRIQTSLAEDLITTGGSTSTSFISLLGVVGTVAATGDIRTPHGFDLNTKTNAGADFTLLSWGTIGNDIMGVGNGSALTTRVRASTDIEIHVGTVVTTFESNSVTFALRDLEWAVGESLPRLRQAPDASSATSTNLTIEAQANTSGQTTKVAGSLILKGGDSAAGAGTHETGGDTILDTGTGGLGTGREGHIIFREATTQYAEWKTDTGPSYALEISEGNIFAISFKARTGTNPGDQILLVGSDGSTTGAGGGVTHQGGDGVGLNQDGGSIISAAGAVTGTGTSDVLLKVNDVTTGFQLRYDGTAAAMQIGVFGVTAVARAAAYTQTYATATRTHAALTSTTLTDSTGGTNDGTVSAITAVGGSGATTAQEGIINDNFKELTIELNALRVDMENVKQVLNSSLDDDQAYGWKQ